jgi:hypothetical protein
MNGIWIVPIFGIVVVLVVLVFCATVAFMIIRAVVMGVSSLFMPSRARPIRYPGTRGPMMLNTVQCPTRMCGAINPAEARFCRRCGRGLPAAHRVQVRRAAVW